MAAETLANSSPTDSVANTAEEAEFGAAMREMRLAHNTDLAAVSSTLRIRQVYLLAIEEGRFNDLPGPTYAAGFVRAYSDYLGLDLTETMRRYREVAHGGRQVSLVAPSPIVEGRMPTGFILLVAAVLAAVAYGSWYYLTLYGRDAEAIVEKLPKQIAEMVGLGSSQTQLAQKSDNLADNSEYATSQKFKASSANSTKSEKKPELKSSASNTTVVSSQRVGSNKSSDSNPEAVAAEKTITLRPIAEVQSGPESTTGTASNELAKLKIDTTPVHREATNEALADRRSSHTPSTAVLTPILSVPNSMPSAAASTPSDQVRTAIIPSPGSSEPSFTVKVPPATQIAAVSDLGHAEAVATSPSRIVLRAMAISWVELRDKDGKRIFSRLLKRGETYNVPNQYGITLATGNAGALDILVDGQSIAPIGPTGAVRRNVLIEPAALIQREPGAR